MPFKDGVFLCQALKLCDEMKSLLSHALMNVPREEDKYRLKRDCTKASASKLPGGYKLPDGFKALRCAGKLVV